MEYGAYMDMDMEQKKSAAAKRWRNAERESVVLQLVRTRTET